MSEESAEKKELNKRSAEESIMDDELNADDENESIGEFKTSKKRRGFLGSGNAGLTKKELRQLNRELDDNRKKVMQLENDLAEQKAKADGSEDKYLRLNAEFDNFRKRKARELSENIKYATESLIIEILPTLNNFETALLAAEKNPETKNFAIGMEMILKQLMDVLKAKGVELIAPNNDVFDPNFHSAVEQVETDEHPDGCVVELVQKGYKLHDRVVQPASVKVSVSPKASGDEEKQNETTLNISVEDKDITDTEEEK